MIKSKRFHLETGWVSSQTTKTTNAHWKEEKFVAHFTAFQKKERPTWTPLCAHALKSAAFFESTALHHVAETVNKLLPPRLRHKMLRPLNDVLICSPFRPRGNVFLSKNTPDFKKKARRSAKPGCFFRNAVKFTRHFECFSSVFI